MRYGSWPRLGFFVLLLSFCVAPSAVAQSPARRLGGSIREGSEAVLPHSRTPRVAAAQNLGALDPETPIPGITLVFRRSAEQEDALQQLLRDQQDTTSPLYHRWLTPQQFGARFGMADADLEATQTWLERHGFAVDRISPSRDRITFSGTAGQVRSTFGAELHRYRAAGETHFAPASDLTLPADLAQIVLAVLHLSDFRPKPNVRTRPLPDYTTFTTGTHYLAPGDLATMYDYKALLANGVQGYGQSITAVGQSYVDTSYNGPVQSFSRLLSLQTGGYTTVLVPGTGVEAYSSGDEIESEGDMEYASGTAQGAQVFLAYVGDSPNYDVFDALTFAIEQNLSPVISISYSICESLLSATEVAQANAVFAQAAAQGQTLVAASGDSGPTSCAAYTTGVPSAQQQALAVNFPADSPYVTAAGGTQMAPGTFTAGASPYWSSAATYSDASSSLLSYVPEIAWNEGSASRGIVAGGGGASIYFARPSWQSGVPGIPAGASRLLPDIALQSSIAAPGYLVCTADPAFLHAYNFPSNCPIGASHGTTYPVLGGTSFAAPVFAGMLAILNQAQSSEGQGNVNPTLYSLAANPATYAAAFHDITGGTTACVSGATNCTATGQSGFAATPGYDEATGLGSVDLANLIRAWPAGRYTALAPTSVLLEVPVYTAAPGQSLAVTIVAGDLGSAASGIPTGTVSVSVDGTVVNGALAFSSSSSAGNATAFYTWVVPSSPGSHVITAAYSGDATHAPSKATQSVLVGTATATGSFTLATGNLSLSNGQQGATQVTLTPASGYSGRVTWALSLTSGTPTTTICYSIAALTATNVSTTKLDIGTGAACNAPLTARLTLPRPNMSPANDGRRGWPQAPASVAYATLLAAALCFPRRRRRRLPALLILLLTISTSAWLTGCGGGSAAVAAATTPSVSAATYTLRLTGTDSVNTQISSSTTFALTVQ